jgi:hypothetical protein
MTPRQQLFADMWNAGAAVDDIAAALGISRQHVHQMRFNLSLPKRPRPEMRSDDPTPEQIAERARECREAHYARRRSETDETARIQIWRHGRIA